MRKNGIKRQLEIAADSAKTWPQHKRDEAKAIMEETRVDATPMPNLRDIRIGVTSAALRRRQELKERVNQKLRKHPDDPHLLCLLESHTQVIAGLTKELKRLEECGLPTPNPRDILARDATLEQWQEVFCEKEGWWFAGFQSTGEIIARRPLGLDRYIEAESGISTPAVKVWINGEVATAPIPNATLGDLHRIATELLNTEFVRGVGVMDAREFDLSDEAPALVTWEVTIERTDDKRWWYKLGRRKLYGMTMYPDGEVYVDWDEYGDNYDAYSSLQEAHEYVCEDIANMVNDYDSAECRVAVKFPPCPEMEVEVEEWEPDATPTNSAITENGDAKGH